MNGRRRSRRSNADDQVLSLFDTPTGEPRQPAAEPRSPERRPPARKRAEPDDRPLELHPSGRSIVDELLPTPDSPSIEVPAYMGGDAVPGVSAESAVSVSSLTTTVKDVLEGAFLPLWVRGEVTDFKAHRNGHWYFCLRDKDAQVRCVVWARDQRRIPAPPDDGMELAVLGQVTVWSGRGDLQLVVKAMEAQGDGLWRKALDAAVARLTGEGLLAAERKRPIPRHPRRVAVVTSPDGAALHDIVAVARRRAPHVEIVIIPTRVQGDGAADEICAALGRLARWGDADVAIVGRGGGGREDLWAFNDEGVARAVAAMPMPVISAVGHEIDVTLCDLVADLRAPTPSAAAEAAVPDIEAVRVELSRWHRRLERSLVQRASVARERRDRVARLVASSATRFVDRCRGRLENASAQLHALSPLATLSRGYALPRGPDGTTLSSVQQYSVDSPFSLTLKDGSVDARVVRVDGRSPSPEKGS